MTQQSEADGRVFLRRSAPDVPILERKRWFFRHPVTIRLTHWINALCFILLLLSGYQIFNAHPALYWGNASNFDNPLLWMTATNSAFSEPKGVTTILGHNFDTTGVFGLSAGADARPAQRGFPMWLTIPSTQDLAVGRRWHFFFAWLFVLNGLVYILFGLVSGQLRWRVLPSRDQIRDFWGSAREHLTLHFPQGDEAKRYNVIQKLTYLVVIFILLPLQIIAGIAMSPGMDATFPWLLTVLGGRQSARTIHFVVAHLLVLFLLVHVFMVIVSGFWNNMRSMVTGWFIIERKKLDEPPAV
ncbi:MAG: cytochrome b/b6 domain-containing protein [Beijerinckiaceae bacterium]